MGRSRYNGKPPEDENEFLLEEIEALRDDDDVEEPFADADDVADNTNDEPASDLDAEPLSDETQRVVDALENSQMTFRQALCALMYLTGTKAAGTWKPELPQKLPEGGMSRPGLIAYLESLPEYMQNKEARSLVNDMKRAQNRSMAQLLDDLAEEERAAAEKADIEG